MSQSALIADVSCFGTNTCPDKDMQLVYSVEWRLFVSLHCLFMFVIYSIVQKALCMLYSYPSCSVIKIYPTAIQPWAQELCLDSRTQDYLLYRWSARHRDGLRLNALKKTKFTCQEKNCREEYLEPFWLLSIFFYCYLYEGNLKMTTLALFLVIKSLHSIVYVFILFDLLLFLLLTHNSSSFTINHLSVFSYKASCYFDGNTQCKMPDSNIFFQWLMNHCVCVCFVFLLFQPVTSDYYCQRQWLF